MCLFCFKYASRLASSLCYSPSQKSPSLFRVAKAPPHREGTVSLLGGGQGKSDLLSATISSTSSAGSSNSPTSTWTGLAPTGSCKEVGVSAVCAQPQLLGGRAASPWLPRTLEMLSPEQWVLRGWVRRRDRTTYLCGGIFNDLCLIRQSLLLQRKMHMSGDPWISHNGG